MAHCCWRVICLLSTLSILCSAFNDVEYINISIVDASPCDLYVTLWFNFTIYQYNISRPHVDETYTNAQSSMQSTPDPSFCNKSKIMLECNDPVNPSNALKIDKISFTTSSSSWYGVKQVCIPKSGQENRVAINDSVCPSNHWHVHTICIETESEGVLNDCTPPKQIIYFDTSRPNQWIINATWSDATNVTAETDTCSHGTTRYPTSIGRTTDPTIDPTSDPIIDPSNDRITNDPTNDPTALPSIIPSKQPTNVPSIIPSKQPTNNKPIISTEDDINDIITEPPMTRRMTTLTLSTETMETNVTIHRQISNTIKNKGVFDKWFSDRLYVILFVIVVCLIMIIVLVICVFCGMCLWSKRQQKQKRIIKEIKTKNTGLYTIESRCKIEVNDLQSTGLVQQLEAHDVVDRGDTVGNEDKQQESEQREESLHGNETLDIQISEENRKSEGSHWNEVNVGKNHTIGSVTDDGHYDVQDDEFIVQGDDGSQWNEANVGSVTDDGHMHYDVQDDEFVVQGDDEITEITKY